MKKLIILFCISLTSAQVFAQCGDISQTNASEMVNFPGYWFLQSSPYQGQTFQVSCDSYIHTVRIPLYVFDVGARDSLFIAFFDGVSYNDTSALLSHPTSIQVENIPGYILPIPLSVSFQWTEIVLDEPVFVSPNITYSFSILRIPVDGVDALHIPRSNDDPYPEGFTFSWNPNNGQVATTGSWSSPDIAFELFSTCVLAGDLNLDGVVDVLDLLSFLLQFGEYIDSNTLSLSSADFDGDGVVTTSDMLIFLSYFGSECEE